MITTHTITAQIANAIREAEKNPLSMVPSERIMLVEKAAKQATSKREFKTLVKRFTGMTDIGFKSDILCQAMVKSLKFSSKR